MKIKGVAVTVKRFQKGLLGVVMLAYGVWAYTGPLDTLAIRYGAGDAVEHPARRQWFDLGNSGVWIADSLQRLYYFKYISNAGKGETKDFRC